MLEDNGICHFEEPCPYWEHNQTKKVKEALAIDVAGGEQDCDISTWKATLEKGIVDIVQPVHEKHCEKIWYNPVRSLMESAFQQAEPGYFYSWQAQ